MRRPRADCHRNTRRCDVDPGSADESSGDQFIDHLASEHDGVDRFARPHPFGRIDAADRFEGDAPLRRRFESGDELGQHVTGGHRGQHPDVTSRVVHAK